MHEIPAIDHLDTKDYLKGYWYQISFIKSIISEGGLEIRDEDLPKFYNKPEIILVESFFRETNYSPETNLGKLVQLIACQESIRVKTEGQRGHKVTQRKLKGGNNLQKMLDTPIEFFAQAIFPQDYKSQLQKLKNVFFMHRITTQSLSARTKLKYRGDALHALVDEISQKFPLTSK